MDILHMQYLPVFIFMGISGVISLILLIIPFISAPYNPDKNKVSAYECGFDQFEDSRGQFDVKFYLVSILFIIFDLEIGLLFPYVLQVENLGVQGYVSVMFFLFVLTVGFIYEWRKGALDWS